MESIKIKNVLISGASMAGLSAAYWMNRIGYKVTVVEIANEPRVAGAAVDIKETAVDAVKRMGIFEKMRTEGLHVEKIEFKNADDATAGSIIPGIGEDHDTAGDEIEIERDKFVRIMLDELKTDI
ncbi:MAG TPA: NAD-binding protein, partial [Cytophaga sp.]|nr:NAD-binding protein [Cytophaga sp.]